MKDHLPPCGSFAFVSVVTRIASVVWMVGRGRALERIERRLAKRHLAEGAEGGQAPYDVSSSYYEGRSCPAARFGHSRDGKRGRPVVVYGLLADAEGRPVAVRAHPGDTAEDAVRLYKNLARVKRAFRCLKTVDLRVRPIHHRLDKRVRAHLFLRVLAYYVEWHLRRASRRCYSKT